MLGDLESTLLAILKIFSPKERRLLKFGGSYWRILDSFMHFEKRKFTKDEFVRYITEKKRKSMNMDDLTLILKRLEENNFIIKDVKGFYTIPPKAVDALGEFCGLVWRPRGGKTGFLKYLIKSKKRVMLWYCLYGSHPLNPKEASQLTKYSFDKCRKYLERFEKKRWLTRVEVNLYKVADEEAIFHELLLGYQLFCMTKPTIRDTILGLMLRHEKVSGKEIHEELEHLGISCDPSTVYKHLNNLEKEKIIRKTGETRKVRGAYEEYYTFNYQDLQKYKEKTISDIRQIIDKSKLKKSIAKEFFDEASKQKPHVLQTFLTELEWLVLQHEDQTASLALWGPFIKNLSSDIIRGIISEFSSITSDEEVIERLETTSHKFKISPLAISIIYLLNKATEGTHNIEG